MTSCEILSSIVDVGALQRELELLLHAAARAARDVDRGQDARDAGQPVAQRLGELVGRALALLQRLQPQVEARLVLADGIAGVDRAVGVVDLGELAHRGVDLAQLGLGVFQRRADRRLDRHDLLAEVGLGHELEADVLRQGEAAEEGRQGDQERELGPAQRPAQDGAVDAVGALLGGVDDAGEAAGAVGLRVVPDRRQHRVEREGHEQRDQHGGRDHDAELEEEAADDAAHEGDRQEHRDDAEGGGEHRQSDLVGAVDGGLAVRLAEADVAHDVLAHHDRVVDQDADGEATAPSA